MERVVRQTGLTAAAFAGGDIKTSADYDVLVVAHGEVKLAIKMALRGGNFSSG